MKVALVCIAKNEDNYIQEWVEYHLKLGFDDVFIYQNDWRCLIENPNVYKVEFDGIGKQMEAYNHFIQNNYMNYDWAAFIDVDEFIVLKKHANIKDFIADYEEKTDSIAINWVFFTDAGQLTVINNNYQVIDRFTKRFPNIDQHIKTISRLRKYLKYDHPHFSNMVWRDANFNIGHGPFNPTGNGDIVQLNHYFSKTLEEFTEKIMRGRADLKTGQLRMQTEYKSAQTTDVDDYGAYNFKNNTNKMEHFYETIDGFSNFVDQGNLLLTILGELNQPKLKIAEIGVYKGRMTAMWNVELINRELFYTYDAIDHFMGSEEHDKSINYYDLTKENLLPIKDRVNIIKNDSIDQSTQYPDNYFDIVYVDASHDYEAVKKDILHWLPKVKSGGIICGDDYIAGWPGVIQAVDEIFPIINRVGGQQWWVKKN